MVSWKRKGSRKKAQEGKFLLKILLGALILAVVAFNVWFYIKDHEKQISKDTLKSAAKENPKQTVAKQTEESILPTALKSSFTYLYDAFREKFGPEEEAEEGILEGVSSLDTSDWKTYKNQTYGFEIKYPSDYLKPQYKRPTKKGSKSVGSYVFQKKNPGSQEPFTGFEVVVYDKNKVLGTKDIDEITKKELSEEEAKEYCAEFEGVSETTIGARKYKAQEISITPADPCYNPAYFYDVVGEKYLFHIIPLTQKDYEPQGEIGKQLKDEFPQFYAALLGFDFVEIKKSIVKKVISNPKPKINAPLPISAKKVGGKWVCAKKHDKPRKSKKHKGTHMDMQCCLDPDEIPNPHCTY